MFLSNIKEATKSKHDLMEELIGSHRIPDFSIKDYCLLIATNYLFHSSLEYNLDQLLTLDQKSEINFTSRLKTNSLIEDLQELHISTKELQFQNLAIADYNTALGWLYVAEGSILGGKYIYQALSHNEEIANKSNFHFYQVYGSETGKMWKSFRELIEQKYRTEDPQLSFTNGAEKAYDFFEASFFEAQTLLRIKEIKLFETSTL